jgi:hypothetical protein
MMAAVTGRSAQRATASGLGPAPLSDYCGGKPGKTGLLVGFAHLPDV